MLYEKNKKDLGSVFCLNCDSRCKSDYFETELSSNGIVAPCVAGFLCPLFWVVAYRRSSNRKAMHTCAVCESVLWFDPGSGQPKMD